MSVAINMTAVGPDGRQFELSLALQHTTVAEASACVLRLAARLSKQDVAKRTYVIRFKGHGENKIECIKEIRANLGVSLKDAKDASEKGEHDLLCTSDLSLAQRLLISLRSCGALADLDVRAA